VSTFFFLNILTKNHLTRSCDFVFVSLRTSFKLQRIGNRTVKLTPRQFAYNETLGFVRAGNEHANAFFKRFRIFNSTYRGRILAESDFGWQVIKAAAHFCVNACAAHHVVFARRDISIFRDMPILDRPAIEAEARIIHDLIRERMHQPAAAPAVPAAPPAPRAVVLPRILESASDSSHLSDSSTSDSEDALSDSGAEDVVLNPDDAGDGDFVAYGHAAVVNRGRLVREAARLPPAVPDGARPELGALYVWNSPHGRMMFDVRITAISDDNRTATFEYMPPYSHHRPDTRPWSELQPPGVAVGRKRKVRQF
jgi:hypothetical protein